MRTVYKRLVSGFLALMLISVTLCSTCSATYATLTSERASNYFAATEVKCTAMGNGKIVCEYDIDATRTMDALGVYYVTFFERQSNGSFIEVKTYNWNNTNGLTESNTASTYGRLWYQGTAGVKYYAEVGCYAERGSDSVIYPQTTRTITAT